MFHIAKEGKPPDYPPDTSEDLKDFLDCCFKYNNLGIIITNFIIE